MDISNTLCDLHLCIATCPCMCGSDSLAELPNRTIGPAAAGLTWPSREAAGQHMCRCSKPRGLCRRDAIGQAGAAGLCAPRSASALGILGSQLAWRVQVPIAAAPTCTRAVLSTDCRAAAIQAEVVVSNVAKASHERQRAPCDGAATQS